MLQDHFHSVRVAFARRHNDGIGNKGDFRVVGLFTILPIHQRVPPNIDNENYCFRLVAESDAEDLLKVYSDEEAVLFFNSDNCNGDDFHYTSLERMKDAVGYWLWEYERRGFVRWSIISHREEAVIGTVELFHRDSKDYFTDCGLLRLDLRSDYEKADVIKEILKQIGTPAFDIFSCRRLVTKAVPAAKERIQALAALGYIESEHDLLGSGGCHYKHYWVLNKNCGDKGRR